MAPIVDTGPLVADPDHARYGALLQHVTEPHVVPSGVLVEMEHTLRPWSDAFPALLAEFDRVDVSCSTCRRPG